MFIKNYSNEVDELKFHYLANISCDLVEAKSIYQYIYIYKYLVDNIFYQYQIISIAIFFL